MAKTFTSIILAVVLITILCCTTRTTSAAPSLATQCADKLQNVMPCLSFANGQAKDPTKQCCESVESMKESNPACLCFVIQQIHNGTNPQLKSLGIDESRLLQLPSACKLVNASISDCPKFLNLPSNSPDAAIFSGTSPSAPTTNSPATGTTLPSRATPDHSTGFKHSVSRLGSILVMLAVFFSVFIAGHYTLMS